MKQTNDFFQNRLKCASRRAFSLIELLISISVVGLLLALLIPAVQQSRMASRRLECSHRLRQIAIATANFESTHKLYPDSYKWRVQLLGYLDEQALAEQFAKTEQWANGDDQDAPDSWKLTTALQQFICPAETNSIGLPIVNYYANMGSGLQAYGFNGFISPESGGVFYYGAHDVPHTSGRTKPADFRDGLSNTVAFSEALVGMNATNQPGAGEASREQLLRRLWKVGGGLITAKDLPEYSKLCKSVKQWNAGSAGGSRGLHTWPEWSNGSRNLGPIIHGWAYDHVLPPNSPSCGQSGGIFSATSLHSGGVNVVFGDGHGKFMSESIDQIVWTALGTRAGTEVVNF